MNVFHWHITDSQSFPIKLKNSPELADYGAYQENQVYTVEDVKALVKYANERGSKDVKTHNML